MTRTERLADVTEFVLDGTHGSPERTEHGIPVLSAQNVRNGSLDYSTDRFTSRAEYDSFRKRLALAPGDVLLTIVGTIGRSAIVLEDRPVVFQRSVSIIRPKRRVLDSSYLVHTIQSANFQRQLASATNQSSQAGVYLGKLKELTLPLPPIQEQRRIAAILDLAESLRAKRRQALAKLDTLTQSLFQKASSDSESSQTRSLKDFATIKTGKLDSNAATIDGAYPFFTCAREDALIDTYAFDQEALLLAGNNAAGEYSVKHYKGKFNAYQRTYVISVDELVCTFEYARFALSSKLRELKFQSKGTGTKYLTLEILHRLNFRLPSISVQKSFAAQVANIGLQRELFVHSDSRLDALHRAIQGCLPG